MDATVLRRLFFHHQRGYRSLAFVLVGALAIGSYAFVTRIPDGSIPRWVLDARRSAVQMAEEGQRALAEARLREGLPFNPGDRFHSGLIGVASSPVTTDLGSLPSHRTSTNPVFAAAVVQMLYRAGVRPGDVVAVGMTGSYPGFDLDVYVGIEAIDATPLVIDSVGASQYGATDLTFTWPAMEAELQRAGVIHHRSIAVSPGGSLIGTQAETRRSIALRTGIPVLPVLPLTQDIKYRERLYERAAQQAGHPIAAFVDVGGSAANVGSNSAEAIIPPGLSQPRWSQYQAAHLGVVGWMDAHRIPIIAMIDVQTLAKKFGIPYDPVLRPTAQDLVAPPANPVGLAVALAALIGLVVAVHRAGWFRVPDWELPPALRAAVRRPPPAADAMPPRSPDPIKGRHRTARPRTLETATPNEVPDVPASSSNAAGREGTT